MSNFSKRLRELRLSRGVSMQKLADSVKMSKSSINMYERDAREPGLETLEAIADFFNVDLDYLIGKTDTPNKYLINSEGHLSSAEDYDKIRDAREKNHINIYRRLNDTGKQKSDDYTTLLAESPQYTDKPLEKVITTIMYFDTPVSAGSGEYIDSENYIMLDLMETPPPGAEFVVRVCGDSMEPTYKDGDKLYIKPQETVAIGEIGVFYINGDVFVKERGADGLISHNQSYKIIPVGEYDSFKCYGKVVGVCKKYR